MEAHFTGLARARVTIAGLGLMGGSLAMALRGQCARLSGIEPDPGRRQFALDQEIVDETISLEEAMESDLLVLAAPVSAILGMLEWTRQRNPGGPLVILDLGSTKEEICKTMQTLPEGCDPIGGHPMCGKECSGIENADANLYRDRTFILTPIKRSSQRAREMALALVEAAGSKPLFLTPKENDRLAAYASHAPYLAAAALVRAADGAGDERVWQVAASGFRDTTRLAASNLVMMADILLTNKGPVLEALGGLRAALDDLELAIDHSDAQALQTILEPVRQRRQQMG